jgi:hypothetical protein
MKLFIKIIDGQPFEHPILEENFVQSYPNIDVNNLPSDFARFERVEFDENSLPLDVYEFPYTQYEWVGSVVTDVWYKRPMSEEQIVAKNQTLVESKEHNKTGRLKKWNAILAELTDETSKQVVQNYIDTLTAYVIADAPLADLPLAPLKNDDGTYTPRS